MEGIFVSFAHMSHHLDCWYCRGYFAVGLSTLFFILGVSIFLILVIWPTIQEKTWAGPPPSPFLHSSIMFLHQLQTSITQSFFQLEHYLRENLKKSWLKTNMAAPLHPCWLSEFLKFLIHFFILMYINTSKWILVWKKSSFPSLLYYPQSQNCKLLTIFWGFLWWYI